MGMQVLASILIRMALAECFCVACGVITLDEPTTNLDVANAAALAQALRGIIDMRCAATRENDRAFQLIVITHDENFATQLGTREYCEYMTRVTKNKHGHSTLTKEGIE
jgi:DNA repair protein RAD50